MLQRILMCAGLATGTLLSGLHAMLTVPLILRAEIYEARASSGPASTSTHEHSDDAAAHHHDDHANADDDAEGWAPTGLQRVGLTLLATILSTVGFSLILVSAAVYGRGELTILSGLGFGIAGFAATGLATSLGLAPELPGSAAAGLVLRQAWWFGTAVSTAAGLAAIVFGPRLAFKILGLVLIVAPHAVGAPGAEMAGSPVPAELSALFAARSLALQGLMWVLLGLICGWIWERQARRLGDPVPT
ncbi:MAG: cobalt transporter [Rhizobiales bacterium]|nr:cobalt transporter [Hyphomicrobiales bacterium]